MVRGVEGKPAPNQILRRMGEGDKATYSSYNEMTTTDNYFSAARLVRSSFGFDICSHHNDQPFGRPYEKNQNQKLRRIL